MASTRQEIQWDLIRRGFATAGRPVVSDIDDPAVDAPRADTDGGAVNYLYEPDALLVRDEHLGTVERLLDRLRLRPGRPDRGAEQSAGPGGEEPQRSAEPDGEEPERPAAGPERRTVEPVIAGVHQIRLASRAGRRDGLRGYDTMRMLRLLRDGGAVDIADPDGREPRVEVAGLGAGAVALNHVVHITGNAGGCPAAEPEPVAAGVPDPRWHVDPCAGEGVRVVVIDTGLDARTRDRSPWLAGVTGAADPKVLANGTLADYAGHGTFIAGLIRGVAPRAEVHVRSVFNFGGGVLETDLIKELDVALRDDHPDIISMSAGTYAADASGLLAFQVFHERRLSRYKGVALVVAAGNDADRRPFWPAAAPYTVSVGALAATGRGRAQFSNFGGWVDVYAPGQDLVNAFPTGRYKYREPPYAGPPARRESFHGMARWSGTSFSTPIVAGLIAARMSRTGENGRTAAQALLRKARKRAQPGVGAVLTPR